MNTSQPKHSTRFITILFALLAVTLLVSAPAFGGGGQAETAAYIVQAENLESAKTAVAAVGGTVTHELGIINAAGAQLTARQAALLESRADVSSVIADRAVAVDGFGALHSATVGVSADGWIKDQVPGEVNSSGVETLVREISGDRARAVYRFDLSSVPANALVTSATVNFWTTQSGKKAVNIHRVTASWDESSAKWAALGSAYAPTAVGSFIPRKSGTVCGRRRANAGAAVG